MIDGKKLVPHWRFTKGFNLARVFDEPQPFDTVLWITGPAALPYLEDGPVSTSEDWNSDGRCLRREFRRLRRLVQLNEVEPAGMARRARGLLCGRACY